MNRKTNNNNAFTLIEILVVITLIGLISAGISASYSQFLKQSRDARRKSDVENVRAALEMYRSNNASGYYPNSIGLLVPTYMKTEPTDPKSGATYLNYAPSPAGCTSACATYILSANLDTGGAYEANPYGASTITVVPSPTP